MLQIENEYETPIESNYYKNNKHHLQNSDNTQKNTYYNEQEFKRKVKYKQNISEYIK